jgi:uncharacterized protein (DUF1684 family)
MTTNDEYISAYTKWQQERSNFLGTQPRSWFNLAALYWLKEGDNTFGSASTCDFVLPKGAPKNVGVFRFNNELVTVEVRPGVEMTCNGGPLPTGPLRDDQQKEPDFLYLGRFILVVLKRGTSTLIRLWDTENQLQKEFTGLNFYPYDPGYRVQAKYVGYAPSKLVKQNDIIGEVVDTSMIGYVVFNLGGKEYHLDVEDGGDSLFIAFHDTTNAKVTFAGGRYVVTPRPKNDQVVIDFNRAFNPPCAYTVYATCVLPSADNRLPVPIEVGEKKYKEDH